MINQNWIFGTGAALNFSTAVPSASSGAAINTLEGCASISNSSGNLLFYTDGIKIWDGSHTIKYAGLLGDPSSTQSSIIVPKPGSGTQYYIFTTDGSSSGSGPFNHFNGVLLDVSNWTTTLLSSLMTMPPTAGMSPVEKLTAVQHKNCKDFWVITIIQLGSDAGSLPGGVATGPGIFRIFTVTAAGVSHHSDIPMQVAVNDLGYLKASPNGQQLALPLSRNKCWTNFPAWPIFSNGSTKPDQANTVRAEID